MAKSFSKILVAAAVGLAAGVGIGMLFAPAKGSKTRKRLKKQILNLTEMIEEKSSFPLDLDEMEEEVQKDEKEPTTDENKEDK
ncbi:MAG: YtxH domain-containing protein [Bacteroidales bacterium]|jgi:gas vesicle protein|nr:YtxH domain-containing protein [Bacteroidales bacterium]